MNSKFWITGALIGDQSIAQLWRMSDWVRRTKFLLGILFNYSRRPSGDNKPIRFPLACGEKKLNLFFRITAKSTFTVGRSPLDTRWGPPGLGSRCIWSTPSRRVSAVSPPSATAAAALAPSWSRSSKARWSRSSWSFRLRSSKTTSGEVSKVRESARLRVEPVRVKPKN